MNDTKVALYHPWIHLKGGGEKVLIKLMEEGNFNYDLFTSYYEPEQTFDEFKELGVNELTPNADMEGDLSRGVNFGLRYILPQKIPNLEDYDALLVSTGGIAELITYRNSSIPTFAYCHTPLRAVHDDSVREKKRKENSELYWWFYNFMSKGYHFLEKPAWKKFSKILCNSENTKQRVLDGNLAPETKVNVINPGADINKFRPGKRFDKVFFVPGRICGYKNQERTIEVFKKFKDAEVISDDFKLVIAGFVDDRYNDYYYELCDKAEGYNIEVLKNPSDKKYFDLYRNCYAVLFTAVNEDWGLVPIEANACGKLCISVNEGGPKESINDGENGFLCDDMEEMVDKMKFMARNPNFVHNQEEICRKEAEKYAWPLFADKVETAISAMIRGSEIRKWNPYEARYYD